MPAAPALARAGLSPRAAPGAGIIADRVFGYHGAVGRESSAALQAANAGALGNSLMAVLGVPWLLCFFAYFRAPLP
jgi:hypothetical protein